MLFDDWQKQNPGYDQYDSKKNDIYLKMLVQTMGPADDVADRRDFGKIIKKIDDNPQTKLGILQITPNGPRVKSIDKSGKEWLVELDKGVVIEDGELVEFRKIDSG